MGWVDTMRAMVRGQQTTTLADRRRVELPETWQWNRAMRRARGFRSSLKNLVAAGLFHEDRTLAPLTPKSPTDSAA